MKTYEFVVNFYSTYGSFEIEADDDVMAYDKAIEEVQNAIKELPVEVEFDVDCINAPEDDGDEDYDEEG